MSEPPTSGATSDPVAASTSGTDFESVRAALDSEGPRTALERLAEHLEATSDYRALLDALLLPAPATTSTCLWSRRAPYPSCPNPYARSTRNGISMHFASWARSIWRLVTSPRRGRISEPSARPIAWLGQSRTTSRREVTSGSAR